MLTREQANPVEVFFHHKRHMNDFGITKFDAVTERLAKNQEKPCYLLVVSYYTSVPSFTVLIPFLYLLSFLNSLSSTDSTPLKQISLFQFIPKLKIIHT
jgi:hypothetical protein